MQVGRGYFSIYYPFIPPLSLKKQSLIRSVVYHNLYLMNTTLSSHSITRLQLSPSAQQLQGSKKIGVTLGAGIPEGFVDLGMLIALGQLRIPVAAVSGSSLGALIGALYASGLDPKQIKELFGARLGDQGIRRLFLQAWQKEPAAQEDLSDVLANLFVELAGWDPDFRHLKIPLFIVASEKTSQRPLIIRHGSVKNALKAALLNPATANQGDGALQGDLLLADGSVFSPLPADILYAENCDFVFGIQGKVIQSDDVREMAVRKQLEPKMYELLGWESNTDISFSKVGCDVLVRPRIPQNWLETSLEFENIIDRGIAITYDAIAEIEKVEGDLDKSMMRRQSRMVMNGTEPSSEELDQRFEEVIAYLSDFDEQVKDLSDAELMDVFPSFTRVFQVFWDRMIVEYPDTESLRAVLEDRFPKMVAAVNDSPFFKRCLDKPQGYAGDYQMMNYVYDDTVFEATSNLAKLFNYYIFDSPAANAVKNRAYIIHGVVQQRLAELGGLEIASIACGPAREVPTTLHLIEDMPGSIHWTLLDQDEDAMAYAKASIPGSDRLTTTFINAGVLELVRKRVDLGEKDIIYSLGLFDYLADKVAIKVIAALYENLKPGGIMLIGNFADHIIRPIMEAAMDWHLIYRTHEDCMRLAESGAPGAQHYVMSEPAGVNLVIVISKPLS